MKRRMPLQQPLRLGYRSLPPSLAALKALQVIKLSIQGLNGSLPDAYGAGDAFPALEVLDVSFNRLSGRLPRFARRGRTVVAPEGNRAFCPSYDTCL